MLREGLPRAPEEHQILKENILRYAEAPGPNIGTKSDLFLFGDNNRFIGVKETFGQPSQTAPEDKFYAVLNVGRKKIPGVLDSVRDIFTEQAKAGKTTDMLVTVGQHRDGVDNTPDEMRKQTGSYHKMQPDEPRIALAFDSEEDMNQVLEQIIGKDLPKKHEEKRKNKNISPIDGFTRYQDPQNKEWFTIWVGKNDKVIDAFKKAPAPAAPPAVVTGGNGARQTQNPDQQQTQDPKDGQNNQQDPDADTTGAKTEDLSKRKLKEKNQALEEEKMSLKERIEKLEEKIDKLLEDLGNTKLENERLKAELAAKKTDDSAGPNQVKEDSGGSKEPPKSEADSDEDKEDEEDDVPADPGKPSDSDTSGDGKGKDDSKDKEEKQEKQTTPADDAIEELVRKFTEKGEQDGRGKKRQGYNPAGWAAASIASRIFRIGGRLAGLGAPGASAVAAGATSGIGSVYRRTAKHESAPELWARYSHIDAPRGLKRLAQVFTRGLERKFGKKQAGLKPIIGKDKSGEVVFFNIAKGPRGDNRPFAEVDLLTKSEANRFIKEGIYHVVGKKSVDALGATIYDDERVMLDQSEAATLWAINGLMTKYYTDPTERALMLQAAKNYVINREKKDYKWLAGKYMGFAALKSALLSMAGIEAVDAIRGDIPPVIPAPPVGTIIRDIETWRPPGWPWGLTVPEGVSIPEVPAPSVPTPSGLHELKFSGADPLYSNPNAHYQFVADATGSHPHVVTDMPNNITIDQSQGTAHYHNGVPWISSLRGRMEEVAMKDAGVHLTTDQLHNLEANDDDVRKYINDLVASGEAHSNPADFVSNNHDFVLHPKGVTTTVFYADPSEPNPLKNITR